MNAVTLECVIPAGIIDNWPHLFVITHDGGGGITAYLDGSRIEASDLACYDRELSADDIKRHYDALLQRNK